MFYLVLSGLIANGLHGFLLYSQRDYRRWTISLHAAKSRRTLLLYAVGHLLAGGLFVLFAKDLFTPGMFRILLVGVAAEYLQAFIPAKGKYEPWHNILAYIMTLSIVLIAIFSVVNLNLTGKIAWVVFILGFFISFSFVVAHLINKKYFWIMQMVGLPLFYIQMALSYLGQKG